MSLRPIKGCARLKNVSNCNALVTVPIVFGGPILWRSAAQRGGALQQIYGLAFKRVDRNRCHLSI